MFYFSTIETDFKWNCPNEQFTISPWSGKLSPDEYLQVKVTFSPQTASVYNAAATCRYANELERKIVKVSGIGKYPHVLVRLPVKRGGKGLSVSTTEKDGGKTRREGGRGSVGGCGSEVVVSFGSVAVGTSTEREIELVNVSAVSSVMCAE